MNITIRTLSFIWLVAALMPLIGANKSPAKRPTAAPPKYAISGSISGMQSTNRARVVATSAGKPVRSITMAADGTFTLRNVPPGSYSVRPSHTLYSFSPSFRTVAVTDHDIIDLAFKATLVPSRKKR